MPPFIETVTVTCPRCGKHTRAQIGKAGTAEARINARIHHLWADQCNGCPLEDEVEHSLRMAGIHFIRNRNGLDFCLPEQGVYLEVKSGHTPRIAEQCSRDPNIIVLQGISAVAFFCERITNAPSP